MPQAPLAARSPLWPLHKIVGDLTNQPQFSVVYTLIDHRNYVIKCSKPKWNHKPQSSGSAAKFQTFYGVIFMVYKSLDHGKLWLICFFMTTLFCFFIITFIFLQKTKNKNNQHCVTCHVISMVYTLIDNSS